MTPGGVSTGAGDLGGAPPSTSTGSGAGDGGYSELGSLLGGAYDSAVAEEAPGGEGGADTGLPSEPPSDTPAGEAPTSLDAGQPEQAQAEGQPAAGQTEPLPGWKLSPDGQSYTVPKTALPQVQSALQYQQTVSQYFPTPADAQSAALQATDLRTMSNDWQYGTDEAIRSVLNHWAGANHQDPLARQAFQRSFARMLDMAPLALKQIDPQAHQRFISAQSVELVHGLYAKAAASQNPQDLLDAQAVDWGLNGKYQTELQRPDPAAQARAQFDRERAQFEQRQSADLTRAAQDFSQRATEGPKTSQLAERIGQHLEPLKAKFSPYDYDHLQKDIHAEIVNTLMQQEWWTEHRQNFDQLIADYRFLRQNGQPDAGLRPRVQSYVNDFVSRASRLLPSIAQKHVNAATAARVASLPQPRPSGPPGSPQPRGPNGRFAEQGAPTPNGQPARRLSSAEWDAEFAKAFR